MTAFSIILRILTLGACGAAVYFWIDKNKVIAQKEAIIQETEFLVGYPTTERKKNSEITQTETMRKENFALIKESTPDDPSYTRLEKLRMQLETIKETDKYFGHKGKTIGGSDPNNNLTLRAHIDAQTQEIESKIKIIDGLNDDIEKLKLDLEEKNNLLGIEIDKVAERDKTIVQKEADFTDLDNKHEQLKTTYNQAQIDHQNKIKDLQDALAKEKQALTLTNENQAAEIQDLKNDLRKKDIEIQRIMRQFAQQSNPNMAPPPGTAPNALTATGVTAPTGSNNPLLGQPNTPGASSGAPNTGVFANSAPLNTKFYMFKPENETMALLAGAKSGIKNLEGKKLALLVNGKRVAALAIVQIQDQYTIFKVRQNRSAPEWKILTGLKKMDNVTVQAE